MFEIKEACKCKFNSSSTWPSGNFALTKVPFTEPVSKLNGEQ